VAVDMAAVVAAGMAGDDAGAVTATEAAIIATRRNSSI